MEVDEGRHGEGSHGDCAGLLLGLDHVLGRNDDVEVLGAGSVGLLEVDLLEIVHLDLEVAADQLDVDHDLLVLGARQRIAVLFVRRKGVRQRLVLGQLYLCVLRLRMDLRLHRLQRGHLQQQCALLARLGVVGSHLVGQLNALVVLLLEVLHALADLRLFGLAKLLGEVREPFVPDDLEVNLLGDVDLVEVLLARCSRQGSDCVDGQSLDGVFIRSPLDGELAVRGGGGKKADERRVVSLHRVVVQLGLDVLNREVGLHAGDGEIGVIIGRGAPWVLLSVNVGLEVDVSQGLVVVDSDDFLVEVILEVDQDFLVLCLYHRNVHLVPLGHFNEVVRCHDLEVLVVVRFLLVRISLGLELGRVRRDGQQDHAVGPALFQLGGLDVDEVEGLELQFGELLVFLELEGEGPVGGVHVLVVGLPDVVHDFEVDEGGLVVDGGAVVCVVGDEVEVRGGRDVVDVVVLPHSVLQLHHGVVHKQGNSRVDLHLHLVEQLQVDLAVVSLLAAQLLRHQLHVQHVHLPVHHELRSVLTVVVLPSVAHLQPQTHRRLYVVRVEVQQYPLLRLELEHVVLRVLGLEVLVMRHSRLQLHDCGLGGGHECEVDPFVLEGLSLAHLHQELQGVDVLGLDLDEAVVRPVGALLVALCGLFLVEDQQVELVGGADEVEGHVLLAGQGEGEEQPALLIVEEVGEGHGVVQLDECSSLLDERDGELRVFECDDLDEQRVVFGGLVDGRVVEGEDLLVAGDLVDFRALGLPGTVSDHVGSVDQQLEALVLLQLRGVVPLVSLPQRGRDALLEGIDDDFLGVLGGCLPNVHAAGASFQGLQLEEASLDVAGGFVGLELLGVLSEDVHALDGRVVAHDQRSDVELELFSLLEREVRLFSHLHLLGVRSREPGLNDQGAADSVHLKLHLLVLFRWLLEDGAEVDGFLLVVDIERNVADGLPRSADEAEEPQGNASGVHEFVEGDVVGSELHAVVSGRDALELVGVARLRADEVEVVLLVRVEDDGLIGVVEFCLGAGGGLLVLGPHEVVALVLVVEEEVDDAHLGVDPLELGIGVEADGAGEGVLEFGVVAADPQCSVVVVGVDCHQLVELVLSVGLLHCRLDDLPAQLARSSLALDLELHLVDVDLAERAELAVGVEEAAGGVLAGGERDGDGVGGELAIVILLALALLEEEDQGLAGFDAVDVVVGGFVVLAEEVVGLDHRLPLLLGLRLLGQLLLAPPALRGQQQQPQQHDSQIDMPRSHAHVYNRFGIFSLSIRK